ncbi:TolC family protein, partial [Cupriavidus basilensis]
AADASQARNEWQATLKPCMTTASVDAYRTGLELLAQTPVPADATAVDEALAAGPAPFPAWQNLIEQNPRVASAANRLEEARGGRGERWYETIESSASVGYYLSDRAGVPNLGHSLVASINFSMPFDVVGASGSRRGASEARYNAAMARFEAERRNLLVELTQALRLHAAAVLDALQSDARLATATERLRERRARQGLDGDQALLQLQAAERERYQAAFARIEAWHGWWTQDAALRLFSDGGPESEALLGERLLRWQQQPDAAARPLRAQAVSASPQAPSRASPPAAAPEAGARWAQGIYVWKSEALLDRSRRPAELAALRAAGMRQVYVGLDAAQVNNLAASKDALRELLDAAQGQGMRIYLLLGDPDWLKPAGRGQLLDLIGKLKDMRFAGLHLDLEVEQLGMPVPDSRLKDWLATVAAVVAASPWPVALSSHHRWFAAPAQARTCIPCALPSLGVRDVSLMIYTRNPQRSAALASEIARRWPKLRFRLAQSVERQLPAEESWAGTPRKQMDAQVTDWQARLVPYGITGIDWQDWRDYPRQPNGAEQ